MIIKAKFIGKSSLGFIYGTTYNLDCKFHWKLGSNPVGEAGLKIETSSGKFNWNAFSKIGPNPIGEGGVNIKTNDSHTLRCEYSKVDIFLSLWKVSSIHLYDVVIPQLQDWYDEISHKFHKNMRDNKIEMILA